MGAGRVLCDDVLRRRMHTCVLSVSSTVGRSVDPGTTKCRDKKIEKALNTHQGNRRKQKIILRVQNLTHAHLSCGSHR